MSLEECHFQGGRDILTFYCANVSETQIFDGKGLLIGGSHKINSFNENSYYGDLSAVLMNNLPTWVNLLKTPDKSIALMEAALCCRRPFGFLWGTALIPEKIATN